MLSEYVKSVMRICDKCNAKTRQVLSKYVRSVPRKRDKCCAIMRQVLQRAILVTKRRDWELTVHSGVLLRQYIDSAPSS